MASKPIIPSTVALFDGDPQNADFARIFGLKDANGALVANQDEVGGCATFNFRGKERVEFTGCLTRHPEVTTRIWDLPGGSLPDMARLTGKELTGKDDGGKEDGITHLINAFERRKSRLTLIHMLHPKPGTTSSVRVHLNLFGDRVDHVAVINDAWGHDYPFWLGHEEEDEAGRRTGERIGYRTREMLLNDLKGVEVHLPALPFGTAARIDALNLPPSKAAMDPRLMPAVQDHCYEFTADFARAVQPALHYLSPPGNGWSRTIATCSGKGGVAKSVYAVALADFFRNRAGR